jgi:hypothetical protein
MGLPETVVRAPRTVACVVPFTVWPEHAEPVSSRTAPPVTVTPGLVVTFEYGGACAAVTLAPGSPFRFAPDTGALLVERRPWKRVGLWLALAWAMVIGGGR